jgi:4-hydroxybenzoate polyprenyltransferase
MVYPGRTIAFGTIMLYSVIQCFYSGFLKHIPYVDVLVIAFGFVLRAVAGAAVIDAYISRWLLVCAFTLSLFLALSKRHHELVYHASTRKALAGYRKGILNTLIFVAATASVLEYLCYTLRSAMGVRFPCLVWTSVFVAFGIGRYMLLVYREGGGGRPEKVLLTDRVLWIALVGYAISAVLAVAIR